MFVTPTVLIESVIGPERIQARSNRVEAIAVMATREIKNGFAARGMPMVVQMNSKKEVRSRTHVD